MTDDPRSSPAGAGVELTDRLALADWRRRVNDLYAGTRDLASRDPRAAWDGWRIARDELYRTHPQSPVPVEQRAAFHGLYYAYDPALRTEATITPANASGEVPSSPTGGTDSASGPLLQLLMSTGDAMSFTRIGTVSIPFLDGSKTLDLFWMAGYAGGLFLPFRDTTNGSATYGAGRYLLDTSKGADLGTAGAPDRLILDFNFAFQPSCAFDPRWSCPLAPPGNRLNIAITGGERLS
ncbi:MAG: DUF1684 domain-containing protein [Chloroflexota bacterium]